MTALSSVTRRMTGIAVTSVVAVGVTLAVAPPASAVVSPIATRSATGVTADALPTAQIDGVVWKQVVRGNTVYAGGSFTTARPAGAAPGVNTVPRNNLMAYDITTGAIVSSFAPQLNGQVKTLALSPDGSRLYVGGDFTAVNGQTRNRIAAFDATTGALLATFAPSLSNTVNAIVATSTSVYVGGAFGEANGNSRLRLAAFRASDGALTAWAPTAEYGDVQAFVLTPDSSKLVVGGAFTALNNGTANTYGMGALSPSTGAVLPWAASSTIKNAGNNAAILSLRTDGNAVYGTGYLYGAGGNLEGAFSANPASGAINWIEDCHGDTYDNFPVNGVVYTVGHPHDCSRVGAYPEKDPRYYQHAVAWTSQATGTLSKNQAAGYADFGGQPSPSLINWFPDMSEGTYTKQYQAAWSVTGNSQYVVLGGEFPTVNGVAQQGLVRFAVPGSAPKKSGPVEAGYFYQTSLTAQSPTSVKVNWPANWDRDDQVLTYDVIRDGDDGHPIYTTTATSQFWNRPTLSYVDNGVQAGTTHSYFVRVTDPDGNTTRGDASSITTSQTSTGPSAYYQQVLADKATNYWRFGDAAGATQATDSTASATSTPLAEGSGVVEGAAGAIGGDSDTAATFSGTDTGTASTPAAVGSRNAFTLETWIKTTTTSGGKIIGFGSAPTGLSASYDRHVYMTNAGKLVFGVYNGAARTVQSANSYNDGNWHHVVATTTGSVLTLYVDGAAVGSLTTSAPTSYTGYWRIGGDKVAGAWPAAPTSPYFQGTIDEVAIYNSALSAAVVFDHYRDSGR